MKDEKKDEKPSGPKPPHSKKKVLGSHVDMEPTAYATLREGVDDRIDTLIRLGLGDVSKLSFYRQVASAPRRAVDIANLRPLAGEMLERLLGLIVSDQQLYLRLRAVLSSKKKLHETGDVVAAALALRTESRRSVKEVDPADEVDARTETRHKKHPLPPESLVDPVGLIVP